MSQKNVEIVRAIYETTTNQLRLELDVAFLSPEIEFHLSGIFPDLEPVYRGHEGMRKLNDQLNEPWDEISLEPERIVERGSRVLVLSHFRAKGRDGVQVRLPTAHLWTLRDGLVVRVDAFSEHGEALAAAGLRE